ncbi:MAG: chromosome segregation protein SMC [candidate division Zixibacteria bacterium]|nr:chromosome segregation protein SMC [candidate division Zixibacteria bacterium]
MHLKRLDILGFKSFANKTSIKYSSGITAIVGPNGCGKTNVLDALRWVLGEQKVSLLRSSKMEEVIFNGTRDVKPLGMAEVSLTIVNDRGVLPTEYNEIQITRRLFRSGESEYLLNKVPCRRKDILELFFDTGMGAHSYSVIQPEMIDAVLSDKAEERRFLFEEAAGITKYKQRKEAALRKLESTENDFLRLKDIYAEVKTRVNSLYRQHKKAERYQHLNDEIKRWELFLSATRIKNIENEKRELKARYDNISDEKTSRETVIDQVTSQLEADRKELLDIERQLTEVSNEIYAMSEKAHVLEKEIALYKEKKNNAVNLIQKNESDIEALLNRTENLRKQNEDTTGNLDVQKQLLEEITARLQEAEEAQAAVDRDLLKARSSREEENKRLLELEGRLSSGKAEGNSLREQEEDLSRQKTELETRINEIYPHQKTLLNELESYKSSLDRLFTLKKETEAKKAAVSERMENLVKKGEELTLEISSLAASIEACEARRNLWEDMMLHYEGYESGLVAAMDEKDRWSGIAGTVGEKFIPCEGLETALEAALGDMAKCLICYNRKTAEEIISYLRTEKKGRISILVPDTGTINPAVKRPELDREEFLGWLDSFVTTDSDLQYLKGAVLSRTAVYKAGTNPDAILARLPYGFSAVSTDGLLYNNNLISGGSDDGFSLFRRKEKVQEQEAMIRDLTQKKESFKGEKDRATAELAAARAEFNNLLSGIDDIAEETDLVQKKIRELEFDGRTHKNELNRLENEKKNLTVRLEKVQDRQYSLGLDFDQLSGQKDNLLTDMNRAGSRLDELEKAASDALDKVSKLHVSMIETRSRVEQAESQQAHISELQKEIDNTLHTKRQDIENARAEISVADEKNETHESNLKEFFEVRERLATRQKSLRDVQTGLMAQVDTKEKNIKEVRREKENLSEESHQFEIRLNTMESEIKSLRDKILDEYDLDIKTVEIEKPDERLSIEEGREQLHEKKERLKKFGAVNLLALEEYRETKEREEFLNEQLNDLTTAKNDLRSTINKINVTARRLFGETFEQVRKNFQGLFVELFTGGEADIHLSVPEDPLESNIEIIARPRGKKLLSISQMSGGERALTAISLLFSLYLVKPSPFCILDEIDAPLDDANCHRFLKIIRNFSKDTQFIAITHNKITMEAANNLYGITMEQPGISKLVAVKFLDEPDEHTGELVRYVNEPPEYEEFGAEHSAPSPTVDESENDSGLPETIKERMNPNISFQDKNEDE